MPEIAKDARILVVDDEEPFLEIVQRIFRSEGFSSIVATTDPRDGLAIARRENPDLILLDLTMPVLDGYGFLGELRSPEADGHPPVIVVTGFATEETREKILRAGAQDILEKPFAPQDLLDRAAPWIET